MEKKKLIVSECIIDNKLSMNKAIKKAFENIEERMSWRDSIHKIRIYKPTSKDVKRLLEKALSSPRFPSIIVHASGKVEAIDNPDLWHNFSMLSRLKREKMKEHEKTELAKTKDKYRKTVKRVIEAYAVVEITNSMYFAG